MEKNEATESVEPTKLELELARQVVAELKRVQPLDRDSLQHWIKVIVTGKLADNRKALREQPIVPIGKIVFFDE